MNEYKIIFSMFRMIGEDKVDLSNHFSNCRATIKGDSYEEALKLFKEQKLSVGWYVATLEEIYKKK